MHQKKTKDYAVEKEILLHANQQMKIKDLKKFQVLDEERRKTKTINLLIAADLDESKHLLIAVVDHNLEKLIGTSDAKKYLNERPMDHIVPKKGNHNSNDNTATCVSSTTMNGIIENKKESCCTGINEQQQHAP